MYCKMLFYEYTNHRMLPSQYAYQWYIHPKLHGERWENMSIVHCWGLSNTPSLQWVAKLVTVPRPVTVCQFATCQQSSVILHIYMNVCGIIILEWEILLHFFACLFVLFASHHNPSWTVTPFGISGTDRVYWACMRLLCQAHTIQESNKNH